MRVKIAVFALVILVVSCSFFMPGFSSSDSNLIVNPSFEEPNTGTSIWAGGTIVSHDAYTGTHSLYFAGGEWFDGYKLIGNVQAGLYHFSMVCKPATIPPSSTPEGFALTILISDNLQTRSAHLLMGVHFTDFSVAWTETDISGQASTNNISNARIAPISTVWRKVAFDVDLPSGTWFLVFHTSSSCYYDDVWLSTSSGSSGSSIFSLLANLGQNVVPVTICLAVVVAAIAVGISIIHRRH